MTLRTHDRQAGEDAVSSPAALAYLTSAGGDGGPEGHVSGNGERDDPSGANLVRLVEQVKSLSKNLDALRSDIMSGRSEFRAEIRGRIDRNETSQERENKKIWDELKERASASEVEKISNNIRTVVMAVVLTVILAGLGLVVVSHGTGVLPEHAIGGAK